ELQRVRGHAGEEVVRVRDLLLGDARAIVGHLDAAVLEPLEDRLGVLLLELESSHQLVELGHVDAAVLLSVLDEELDRIDWHLWTFPGHPCSVTWVRSSRDVLPDSALHSRGSPPPFRATRLPRAFPQGQVPAARAHDADEGAAPQALVPEGEHSRARAPES